MKLFKTAVFVVLSISSFAIFDLSESSAQLFGKRNCKRCCQQFCPPINPCATALSNTMTGLNAVGSQFVAPANTCGTCTVVYDEKTNRWIEIKSCSASTCYCPMPVTEDTNLIKYDVLKLGCKPIANLPVAVVANELYLSFTTDANGGSYTHNYWFYASASTNKEMEPFHIRIEDPAGVATTAWIIEVDYFPNRTILSYPANESSPITSPFDTLKFYRSTSTSIELQFINENSRQIDFGKFTITVTRNFP